MKPQNDKFRSINVSKEELETLMSATLAYSLNRREASLELECQKSHRLWSKLYDIREDEKPNSFPLNDMKWRDEHIDSLHDWHPCFKDFRLPADMLLATFTAFIEDYIAFCNLHSADSDAENWNHITHEALLYFFIHMERIAERVWRAPQDESTPEAA